MIAFLLSVGVLTAAAAISLAATSRHHSHSSRHHPSPVAAPQGQIACTVGGCERIPAACTPVPGRTWWGMPTGYDVIACPGR
jgi:hypothetical protein